MKYQPGDIVILTPDDKIHYGKVCAYAKIIRPIPRFDEYEIFCIVQICDEKHFYRSNGKVFAYEEEILRKVTIEELEIAKIIYS